jgi:molybdate transport system permease protein
MPPELDLAPLWLTLKVASIATMLAFVFSVGMALLLARGRFAGREVLDATLTLPLVLPPTVLGYYLLVVVGRKGWLGQWWEETFGFAFVFTWQGAVLAAAIVSFPLILKSARAAFEGVEPGYERAGRTLGIPEWEVFARITFPLAWRGILAGTLLAFARAMGEFGATLMLAGNLPGKTQTLSIAIYDAVQAGDDPLASTLVAITSLTCIVILLVSSRLLQVRHA